MFGSAHKKTRMQQALDAVQSLIKVHGVDALHIRSVLKADPRADVFKADLAGDAVVIKRYKGAAAADQVRDAAQELQQLAGHMAFGPNLAVQARGIWPEPGLIALSFVTGTTLTDALSGADRTARDALLRRAGNWASHYSTGRRQDAEIAPRFWIKKAAALDRAALTLAQRETWRALMAALRAAAPALRAQDLPRGAVHGDLIGANLMVDGERCVGVDINGTLIRPLAWEAAHFLIWHALRPPFARGQAAYLDQFRSDRRAFLSGHAAIEDDAALHFFLIYQCCVRLAAYAQDGARADALSWLTQEVLG